MKRAANWVKKITLLFERVNSQNFFFSHRPGEKPIIGSDKEIISGLYCNRFPLAADTGIDDREVDGAFGKETVTRGQRECTGTNVARGHVMCDVDDACSWSKACDNSLEGADKPIAGAKVCG